MAEIQNWHLKGDWFDVCRCRVPCACTFAQAPDEDECNGILAWHIREGSFGEVALDDLSVVAVASFEGNIWAGEAKNSRMGFYIDERADDSQREALQIIFGGDAGGWPAGFAELIEDVAGIEYAPIEFELADDLSSWRVEVPGKARGSAEALTGPTSPDAPVQGAQRPRRRGRPGPGGDLRDGDRGRGRGVRVQVELAGPLEQALPL